MDLSTLVPSERMIEILSPATKTPLGLRVTIMHIDDPRLKTIDRKSVVVGKCVVIGGGRFI